VEPLEDDRRPPGPHRGLGTLGLVVLGVSIGPLPVFLLGALAVFVRADLPFGQAQLGAALAGFFAIAAMTSITAGGLVERAGWRRGMALGMAGTALTLASVALARSWPVVLVLTAAAGAAVATCQLASNLALTRGVLPARQGLAFGVKQSAVPVATLLAGLTVPVVALGLGWRAAFMGAAAVAGLFSLGLALTDRRERTGGLTPSYGGYYRRGPLLLLAAAAGLGMAGGNAVGAFYVDGAVQRGVGVGIAGMGLALGSASSVLARIAWGWVADHRPERALSLVAGLFFAGAVGFALLAARGTGLALAAGTVLAFAAGWGWPGVLVFAIVRDYVDNPAVASGYLLMGVYAGGTLGPLLFGNLVEAASYAVGWSSCVAGLVLGGLLVLRGRTVLAARGVYAAGEPREHGGGS
jgi:MFS family permease